MLSFVCDRTYKYDQRWFSMFHTEALTMLAAIKKLLETLRESLKLNCTDHVTGWQSCIFTGREIGKVFTWPVCSVSSLLMRYIRKNLKHTHTQTQLLENTNSIIIAYISHTASVPEVTVALAGWRQLCILNLPVWVLSGFLPHSKDMFVSLIGDSGHSCECACELLSSERLTTCPGFAPHLS